MNVCLEEFKENFHRRKIIRSCRLGDKIMTGVGLSIVPFLGELFAFDMVKNSALFGSFFSSLPVFVVPTFIMSSVAVIGFAGQRFIKKNSREEMKTFSKAKSEKEKIEEEIEYAIAVEKAINKHAALGEMRKRLKQDEDVMNALKEKYEISSIRSSVLYEGQKRLVDKLHEQLRVAFAELDRVSTKKVLNEKFRNYRYKLQWKANLFLFSVISGIVTLFATMAPVMLTTSIRHISMIFGPLFLGMGGYTIVDTALKNVSMRVFSKFNRKLGDDGLPYRENEDGQEEKNIELDKQVATSKICNIGSKLIGEIGVLEAIKKINEGADEPSLEKSLDFESEAPKQEVSVQKKNVSGRAITMKPKK